MGTCPHAVQLRAVVQHGTGRFEDHDLRILAEAYPDHFWRPLSDVLTGWTTGASTMEISTSEDHLVQDILCRHAWPPAADHLRDALTRDPYTVRCILNGSPRVQRQPPSCGQTFS